MITVALYAALAMVLQDVFGVLLVQAEARNHGWLTGVFDSAYWLAAIATTTIAVTSLQGHSFPQKVVVILAVTTANFAGSLIGVWIGKRYIKEDKEVPADDADILVDAED